MIQRSGQYDKTPTEEKTSSSEGDEDDLDFNLNEDPTFCVFLTNSIFAAVYPMWRDFVCSKLRNEVLGARDDDDGVEVEGSNKGVAGAADGSGAV